MRNLLSRYKTVLLILIDILILLISFSITFYLRYSVFGIEYNSPNLENLVAFDNMIVSILIFKALIYYFNEIYRDSRYYLNTRLFFKYLISSFILLFTIFAISFIYRAFAFPRLVIVISIFIDLVLNLLWRFFLRLLKPKEYFIKKIILIGDKCNCLKLYNEIEAEGNRFFSVLGCISDDQIDFKNEKLQKLGNYKQIKQILLNKKIDTVILANTVKDERMIYKIKALSEELHFDVTLFPDMYDISIGKLDLDQIAGLPLVKINKFQLPLFFSFCKFLFDKVFSLIFIILFSPVYLIVAILIKLDSKGPIFYLQKRLGMYGKEYSIIKFRTMRQDAEKATGPVFAQKNDDRITKLGKFLRKTRLDEIPQFFNVLFGSMSIVGPRPERKVFVDEFEEKIVGYKDRKKVKPGITGLAQIYGRYNSTAEDKLKYDMIYVHNIGFLFEIQILVLTIKVVVTGHGAH